MGKRPQQPQEELREKVIAVSGALIAERGLAGLSARTIASRVGYSAGTLYNVFVNLDEIILEVEGQMLDELALRLEAAGAAAPPSERLARLAEAYHAFAVERPRLWNVLLQHHLPADRPVPGWYRDKLEAVRAQFEGALRPLMGGSEAIERAARATWAAVHGATALATSDKLAIFSAADYASLVASLVRGFASTGRPEHSSGASAA